MLGGMAIQYCNKIHSIKYIKILNLNLMEKKVQMNKSHK